MKMKTLAAEVMEIVREEEKNIARGIIHEKVIEIRGMKVVLKQAEAQLEELLNKEVSDVVWSE